MGTIHFSYICSYGGYDAPLLHMEKFEGRVNSVSIKKNIVESQSSNYDRRKVALYVICYYYYFFFYCCELILRVYICMPNECKYFQLASKAF